MLLTPEEQQMLEGAHGRAVRKSMEILTALGKIYGAEAMVPVSSVQISGVSYDNLGEAGLEFLTEMAEGGGRARVLTTLNPAGMDIENWQALGIDENFASSQKRVIDAFAQMGVVTTCSCTPYLSGNVPHYGEHIAWAESSAVCYANSVLGARTNREGGPSALAAALTGRTPAYGFHLSQNRQAGIHIQVKAKLENTRDFGALGMVVGRLLEKAGSRPIPYLRGIPAASLEQLKAFCASLATYGGAALFHMEGITPEAGQVKPPEKTVNLRPADLEKAVDELNEAEAGEVDFYSLGCPHLSLAEIMRIAEIVKGRKVRKEFWITTARPTKDVAERMGMVRIIEESGIKFAVDTCCVVAPIRGRFHALATDSAKACYYAASKNKFKTRFLPFEKVLEEALI